MSKDNNATPCAGRLARARARLLCDALRAVVLEPAELPAGPPVVILVVLEY